MALRLHSSLRPTHHRCGFVSKGISTVVVAKCLGTGKPRRVAPLKYASAQVPKLSIQAPNCDVPPN